MFDNKFFILTFLQLVNDYLRDNYYSRLGFVGGDVNQLNIAACRLMLDVMPGLETSVVFQVGHCRGVFFNYPYLAKFFIGVVISKKEFSCYFVKR